MIELEKIITLYYFRVLSNTSTIEAMLNKETVSGLPPTVLTLVDRFASFPGVGKKSALRMAMHILRGSRKFAEELSGALLDVKDKVALCHTCWTLSEQDPCPICCDHNRDSKCVCVVEEARDMIAIERTGCWRGVYHVLGGAISPLDGVDPEQLKIDQLFDRVKQNSIKEIVIATNPTSEGETTALYIARMMSSLGVKVTRIARGVPMGSDIELVDDNTLQQSFEGRVAID